jgi:hypothetical protein
LLNIISISYSGEEFLYLTNGFEAFQAAVKRGAPLLYWLKKRLRLLFHRIIIAWIEKLLQTPIDDYRKNAVSLILAPYLINIKKLSYDHALNIINSWLRKCGLFLTG